MKKVAINRMIALALVAMFTLVSNSHAQEMRRQRGGEEMREHKREMRGPRIPDLTEEQEEQLKALKVEHSKEALPLHNEVKEKEARLQTLTTADEFNSSEVGRVIESIGDLKTELMKLRVTHMQEVKEILTEEQVVFLNNQVAKRPEKRPFKRR